MIDNISFNFKFKPDEDWLSKLENNLTLKKIYANGKVRAFKGKLFLDKNVKKKENDKSKPSLYIVIKLLEDNEVLVIVKNSLRKWFFDTEVIGDFNKTEFEECLNLISEKLYVTQDILLSSKVTKVEYGGNLKFREQYRCFYACIHSHKDIKKKCTYGNETVEFKGKNRSVIFYDKITEQKEKTFKAKNQKKLNNVVLLLRYEIKVIKLSNSIETPFMSYLSDIYKNWDKIVDLWVKELDKITFVNNMNSKVYDYLKDAKIKPMKDYLIYLGMESLGLDKWQLILYDRMFAKIRKSSMDSQLGIYNDFKSKIEEESFEFFFKDTVSKKAENLKLR
jgi:hypothetical protein